jgi:hypothetical protein
MIISVLALGKTLDVQIASSSQETTVLSSGFLLKLLEQPDRYHCQQLARTAELECIAVPSMRSPGGCAANEPKLSMLDLSMLDCTRTATGGIR